MNRVLSPEEIQGALGALPGWRVENGWLVREVRTRHWRDTVFVVNGLAALAEAHHHHPDLGVSYRKVEIRLHTHDVGGLTGKDLQLARVFQDWLENVHDLEQQEV